MSDRPESLTQALPRLHRVVQRFLPLLRKRNMPKVARAFEWCAGPGFIGFSLLAHGLCDTLCLADVNPEAVAACRRTIARNGLAGKAAAYVSDNLKDIPASERRKTLKDVPVFDRADSEPKV